MIFSTKPSRRETIGGGIYLILYIAVMPWLVPILSIPFADRLDAAQINFIYFMVNFAATTVIFRKFLLASVRDALVIPSRTLWYTVFAYLGSRMLGGMVASAILSLEPEFANINDQTVSTLLDQNFRLMAIGSVFLAPVTEELLFRGLIFRGLYNHSPIAAHLVSMVLFSVIHVSGYVGMVSPKVLFLCFLQYLPAGYCLNFAYRYSGTIAAPILMHILTNLFAVSMMR